MFTFFEFVYNNLIIIGIIVVSLALSAFLLRTFLKEFLFNRRLNVTQNILRNFTSLKDKRPSFRSLYKVVLPLLIPVVFILGVVRNPIVYDGHVNYVHTKDDILNIRENFNSKFYSTPLRTTDDVDTEGNIQAQMQSSPEVTGSFGFMRTIEDYLISQTEKGVEVTTFKDDDLDHSHSLSFFPEYENVFIEGINTTGSNVVVMGYTQYDDESEDYTPYTFLKVYDASEDFEIVHRFKIHGPPSNISFNNNRLIVTTNQYLPFLRGDFELDDFLPRLIHNDEEHIELYSKIRHIEGTQPNNFVAVFHIHFDDFSHDMTTILTDVNTQSKISGNSIYLLSNSYEFSQLSDYLELEDPIENYNSAFTKLNVNAASSGVHYFRTRVLEGTPLEDNGILAQGNLTMAFLENETDDETILVAHRFSTRLDVFLSESLEDIDAVRSIRRHENLLLIKTDDNTEKGYNIAFPAEMPLVDLDNYYFPPENVIFKDHDTMLSMHIQEGRIYVTPHIKSDDEYVRLEFAQIHMASYRINTFSRYYSLNDIYYRQSDRVLRIPRVITTNDEMDEYTTEIRVMQFDRSDYSFNTQFNLKLPQTMHEIEPFVYRMHRRGNFTYHITPGGIAVTHNNEPSEILDYVTFD